MVHWKGLLLLTTLALFTTWVNKHHPFFQTETLYTQDQPAHYMDTIQAVQFDKTGHVRERIQVAHWEHRLGQPFSSLTQLAFSVLREDGSLWHMQADHGKGFHPDIATSLEFVHLQDRVLLTYQNHAKEHILWKCHTDELLLYPKFIQTAAPLRFLGPNGIQVTAIGMHAQLDLGHIELLDHVEGLYPLQPSVIIHSDRAYFNIRDHTLTHEGHVHVRHGMQHLYSEHVHFESEALHQNPRMTAKGQPARFESFDAQQEPHLRASAHQIIYHPSDQQIRLEGEAVLQQGTRRLQGELIVYDLQHQQLISHSDPTQPTHLHFTRGS